MAEPNSPTEEETADSGRHAAVPEQTSSTVPATSVIANDTARDTIERNRAESVDAEPVEDLSTAGDAERTAVYPAPIAPAEPQPVIAPAAVELPALPQKQGNRLVGTLWVLLAAGIFQVVFFGINALIALSFGSPAAVPAFIEQIAKAPLAWLPVLLFFLLFELVVLLTNRAGRVVYVFASLIVGAVVYVLNVVLYSLIVNHSLGDSNSLGQLFLSYEFILIGLVAREVMLWTGLAIGSRGIRVRRRNLEARRRFDRERRDVRA